MVSGLQFPKHIWIELGDAPEADSCDVIIEMEDGMMYTALFVTMPYLRRQMDLTFEMSRQMLDTPVVRYVALDAPHILVDSLDRETLEDVIDNLLAQDVFEGFFTQVTDEVDARTTSVSVGKRATTEIAAVVLSDVLVITGDQE
ncbi:MAG: hypothetical protein H7175_15535 [Burkholderiales bacterium]|nr:hypothetical protein [Anaerolineae bacterium]